MNSREFNLIFFCLTLSFNFNPTGCLGALLELRSIYLRFKVLAHLRTRKIVHGLLLLQVFQPFLLSRH